MKRNTIHYCLLVLLVGLIALSGNRAIARETIASTSPRELEEFANAVMSFGLIPGQTLRYTWANQNDPDPRKREIEPLRILVKLFAADGSVIAQAEAAAVGVGQFQSFDFPSNQINLPGEAGTGRLQVRLEMTMLFRRFNSNDLTLKRGILETFDDVAEVIDTLTGRTTVSFKPKEIVVVGSKINEK